MRFCCKVLVFTAVTALLVLYYTQDYGAPIVTQCMDLEELLRQCDAPVDGDAEPAARGEQDSERTTVSPIVRPSIQVSALASRATYGDKHQTTRINSTCSDKATNRGPHQRVVSFNFYGDIHHKREYFQGIERNAKLMPTLYPNWTMRVYHDVNPDSNSEASSKLKRLAAEFPFLDLCFAGDIPGFGDITETQQNAWRYLPMADPLVDIFVCRDLDAVPIHREVDAVREWLASNLTFHVMRDCLYHTMAMLAGMWGARPELHRCKTRTLAQCITLQPKGKKENDQHLLAHYLWPATKGDVLQHDAYHCKEYATNGHVRPFPTRRNIKDGHNFVGNMYTVHKKPTLQECPLECRPPEHRDWKYC